MLNETPFTDDELMRQMARDRPDAFDALFLRHRRAVYGFLWRMTCSSNNSDGTTLAEDLTQECFLRFWRARHDYRKGDATVRTYLLIIARNLYRDSRKKPQAVILPLNDDADFRPSPTTPETRLLTRELHEVIEAALRKLPDDLREVVLLREGEGFAYTEIAHIIGCPLGTLKSRLFAARTALRTAVRAYLQASESES